MGGVVHRLRDGDWAGRSCFIVGGGPSLRGFDWTLLKGKLTIAINRAFEDIEPSVIFGMDKRFFADIEDGSYGAEARTRFHSLDVPKVCTESGEPRPIPQDVDVLPMAGIDGLTTTLADGLCTGGNSGYAAINLALNLGASTVYLLGFDMMSSFGAEWQEHYHDGHPRKQPAGVYANSFVPHFEKNAEAMKARARIVNLTQNSALHCFEKQDDFPVVHIEDGAWAGQPCVIVGGGPSLKGFDWDSLRGFNTIAINRAFESFTPSVMLTADYRLMLWLEAGDLGADAQAKWRALRCPKVLGAACDLKHTPQKTIIQVLANEPCKDDLAGEMTTTLEDGLLRGTSSGVPALNLALNMGANPIYLLGFDCQADADGAKHFHDGYGDAPAQPFNRHIAGFDRIADAAKARAEIINCSPNSALTCFHRGIWPLTRSPVYVSCYTPLYAEHAARLSRSLAAHGLDQDVQEVEDLGRWELNCAQKAGYIAEMRRKYRGRAVVWLDADAVVQQPPELLHIMNGTDFAAHLLGGKELLSGTLYFGAGPKATNLLARWIMEQADTPNEWDQRCLARALKQWDGSFKALPAEYCRIYDNRVQAKAGRVIEHFQASRELKQEVNA